MAKKLTYEELEQRVGELEKEVLERQRAEQALEEKTWELAERVKELNCLYEIGNLREEPGMSLEKMFRRSVDLIPAAWQFPDITCARLAVDGQEYKTSGFRETPWRQTSEIVVHGKTAGILEIFYLEERPERDEGPFLREERDLLDVIVERLRRIIEYERTEEALRESEQRYKTLTEKSLTGIFIYQDGKYVLVNDRFAEIHGYKPEEMLGKDPMTFIHPEQREMVKQRTEQKLKGEPLPPHYELQRLRKGGDTIWCESIATRIEYRGKPALIGNIVDITERKRAEEALKESEAQKKAILDASVDRIRLVDKALRIIWANKTTTRELNRAPEDLIGHTCYKVLVHRDTPCDGCPAVKALNSGQIEHSVMHQTKSKTTKGEAYWDDYAVPIENESGEVVNIIEITRNITESKLMEEALKESEEKYRSILENIEDGYFEVDIAGNFTFFNDSLCRILGYSNDEMMGMNNRQYMDKENAEKVYQAFNKAYNTRKPARGFDWEIIRKDGTKRHVEASVSLIMDPEGEPIGFRGIVRDITERKRLEEQLLYAQKIEAIGTLAGGIAHEFNNALVGITGNIELLKMDLPEDESVDRYIEPMKTSTRRMVNLSNQLLAYAQGGKYQERTISLSHFVEDTLPLIQNTIDPAIRVETDLSRDILDVSADQTQLQMVLSAVVDNATEAIEGEGRIKIITRDEEIDDDFAKTDPELKLGPYACLTIEDDGKGMDEETKGKIFDPFFTTKFQGRGLGMAAVHGIVRNHGGWISVDSELGKGTMVHIYLPARALQWQAGRPALRDSGEFPNSGTRKRGGLPLVEPEKKEVKEPKTEVTIGTRTVLVIEDEEMVMDVARAMLERLGYRVLETKTGMEAVNLAKTFDGDIDLAVLDMKLPDMEGGKVYPLIKEARPNLKVIVCSGYSIDGPAEDILNAGAQDFIQKPFSMAGLSAKLEEVLTHS